MTRAARLRLGPWAGQAFVLLAAAVAVTGCGSAQPTLSTTTSPTPRGDCPVTTEPGPADEPNRDGGDSIDMTDYGGGRWRLCLTVPMLASVEHTAWCIWTPDRTAVSEVDGLGASIGPLDYDASVSIGRNQFDFGTIDRQSGLVASYKPGPIPFGDATDDGRAGHLAFEVALLVDPEGGAPPDVQPRYAGSMSWSCSDPPPHR